MASPAQPRRLDAALVTRVLALNPACLHLNLARNNLTCAARGDEGVLAPLRDLLQLNLSSNALRALGPEFSALAQLQVLDVSRNQMCAKRCSSLRARNPRLRIFFPATVWVQAPHSCPPLTPPPPSSHTTTTTLPLSPHL